MPRSEQMMRILNASRKLVTPAYTGSSDVRNRGQINEAATRLVNEALIAQRDVRDLTLEEISKAVLIAQNFIRRFRARAGTEISELSDGEIAESMDLAVHLMQQLMPYWESLSMFVALPGAGIVDGCEADGIAHRTLLEVKAGDRLCRSRDIRQVLIYAALAHLAGTHQGVDTLSVVNPRVGWSLTASIESVLDMSGGKTFESFLAEFENYVTDTPHVSPALDREFPSVCE
jgi:hypothetical protein